MKDTKLVFIVGSGRCGTKALVKMLAGTPGIEAHHEYCRYSYQREAVLYIMGRYSFAGTMEVFYKIFESAAYYSEMPIFLDSSHKLVPALNVLTSCFPDAKFIHLMRDGRKVCESFYYKLQIHDDRAFEILQGWWDDKYDVIPPPSEKYWLVPAPEDYNRWQRVCWHWKEYNQLVISTLEELPAERKHTAWLEEITTDAAQLRELTDFIGVPWDDRYWKALQRPDHVYVPVNYHMTDEQLEQFDEICGPMMEKLGYTGKEYDVKY